MSTAARLAGLEGGADPGRGHIITNKNLLPVNQAGGRSRRRRLGTTDPEMGHIAGVMADVVQRRQEPAAVRSAAADLRRAFPTLQFCFPLNG